MYRESKSKRMRLETIIKKCRHRGGDCPCREGKCQAEVEIQKEIVDLRITKQEAGTSIRYWEGQLDRLRAKPATLKDGWEFNNPIGYCLAAINECGEWTWGYCSDETEDWIEGEGWPFNENYVYGDDWERFGFQIL